ncbi:MAG: hypothetical protein KDA89_20655, partial [Planctomycetaceae bacterium]|nr:hypothetical protein [Planctomycetaceae bacterium]
SIDVTEIGEADGDQAAVLTVTRNSEPLQDLQVSLSGSDDSSAAVPASVVIPAGEMSVTVDIAAVDDDLVETAQNVTFTATALNHVSDTASVTVTSDDVARISVVPAVSAVSEDGGAGATTLTISRNTTPIGSLVVTLSFTGSDVTAPTRIVIPVGQMSVVVPVDVADNGLVDGDRTAEFTATASIHAQGTADLLIQDDDVPTLSLTPDITSVAETAGSGAVVVTVSRNTDPALPLEVTLESADLSELEVAAAVTIPAGETSVTVELTVVDDNVVDGTQVVTISAATAGFVAGTTDIDVTDNEGGLRGQKWHDRNGNGVREPEEPGLNGWMILLLDEDNNVVASDITHDMDLNDDQQIDPITESGWYSLTSTAGEYRVREVPQPGWRQTTGIGTDPAFLAWSLDQSLQLDSDGELYPDWGGQDEVWIRGGNDWYYITPEGQLFRWDGGDRAALAGELIAQLSPDIHADPAKLFNAPSPQFPTVGLQAAGFAAGPNFGNAPSGAVRGRKWLDINADGQRTTNEPWLNGWAINLTDRNGNVIDSVVTHDIDLNGDGVIDPERESGWYEFLNVLPGSYEVTEIQQPQWSSTRRGTELADQAADLDRTYDFQPVVNEFRNFLGLDERWIWSAQGQWFFITPGGLLHRFEPARPGQISGVPIAQLDALYWDDPSLLTEAADRGPFFQSVSGQQVSDLNFGSVFAVSGTGTGNVTVQVLGNDVIITGDVQSNSVSVYA